MKEMADIFRENDSSGSIYLTPKTTSHVRVWNTQDSCHIYENEILPLRRLPDRCQCLRVLCTPVSQNEDQPARRANQ